MVDQGLSGFLVRLRTVLPGAEKRFDSGGRGLNQTSRTGVDPAALGFVGAVPAVGDSLVVTDVRSRPGERIDQA